ncbi:hypothetical protein [Elizabethkingia miricola]|uniref:hypothetical protein n=1 Tax=Elizabethkingia miricola TaxID=172045 RepID=UPI00117CC26C|nr:hypothetical protein [Elizabethkingia miricola]
MNINFDDFFKYLEGRQDEKAKEVYNSILSAGVLNNDIPENHEWDIPIPGELIEEFINETRGN